MRVASLILSLGRFFIYHNLFFVLQVIKNESVLKLTNSDYQGFTGPEVDAVGFYGQFFSFL